MDADLKKKLQISLLVFVVIAGIRVGFIFYARRDTGGGPKKPETTYSSNMDDYVTPHKIFPYNVESAKKELVGKPLWVKTGNLLPYYAYDAAAHSVNFKKQAGLLPPAGQVAGKRCGTAREPALKAGQVAVVQKKMMAVFEKSGRAGDVCCVPLAPTRATITLSPQTMSSFSTIPIELYKHWPADTWSAIDQHQVKQGMSELQASFALGTNMSAE